MKFGVIGCAHNHILTSIEEVIALGGQFIGIADDKQHNVRHIHDQYNIPVLSTPQELLEQDVDLILCSAVNYQKMDIIALCHQHNTHILCDKPIVINASDQQRLESIVDEGRIHVGLLLTLRFERSVARLKQLIDDGDLGEIIHIEIMNPHNLHAATRPAWHFIKDQNGGIVIDLMVHSVDLFHHLTGNSIQGATCHVHDAHMDDHPGFAHLASAHLTGHQGTTGYLRVDWLMPDGHWAWGDARIFCQGTLGCAELRILGDPIHQKEALIYYRPDQPTVEVDLSTHPEDSATVDFIHRIHNKPCSITAQDIVDACRETLHLDQIAQQGGQQS